MVGSYRALNQVKSLRISMLNAVDRTDFSIFFCHIFYSGAIKVLSTGCSEIKYKINRGLLGNYEG